jgi:hypothetical protein
MNSFVHREQNSSKESSFVRRATRAPTRKQRFTITHGPIAGIFPFAWIVQKRAV